VGLAVQVLDDVKMELVAQLFAETQRNSKSVTLSALNMMDVACSIHIIVPIANVLKQSMDVPLLLSEIPLSNPIRGAYLLQLLLSLVLLTLRPTASVCQW
jgi:uncharacterized protein with PQ loop repeat